MSRRTVVVQAVKLAAELERYRIEYLTAVAELEDAEDDSEETDEILSILRIGEEMAKRRYTNANSKWTEINLQLSVEEKAEVARLAKGDEDVEDEDAE